MTWEPINRRSPSASRWGARRYTQVPLRLPRSRTTSRSRSHEILACGGDKKGSSGKRRSPSCRPMVTAAPRPSKRCMTVPVSSSNTRVMVPPVRCPDGDVRTNPCDASVNGAPHVAQKRVSGVRGDAQRAQLGPDPGAVRRRPQCGQNGSPPLAWAPQKGQAPTSGATASCPASWTPRALHAAAAALIPEDFPRGLPQSIQNWAPASLSRPQYVQVTDRGAPKRRSDGLPIYWTNGRLERGAR